ncbi:VIT1/CCC1 transporter family protein [Erysipelotrichaceae bacterium OttesenSCG-928-M19]|nr:VIT1/CCC1 transporter family protein [Erysipelotrichaceae bacterium OttesenSCG-928-M19]
MKPQLTKNDIKALLAFQKAEITDHTIYLRLAKREKDSKNKKILEKIASDEKDHYNIWKNYTNVEVKPNKLKILWYTLTSYLMGYTFTIKTMEKNEYTGSKAMRDIKMNIPEINAIIKQEDEHEELLIEMLDEERLQYIGSIVLGLNDALVELTGTIAGLTLAFANTSMIALSGIITGISATLSMAASNYLAERANNNPKALKSSLYTGVAYLITVALLVIPYLALPNQMYFQALAIMITVVILVIFFFNYYVSITKNLPFKKQFLEMAIISLSVAALSFVIGICAKMFLGIDV